jgi:hypothetical protein
MCRFQKTAWPSAKSDVPQSAAAATQRFERRYAGDCVTFRLDGTNLRRSRMTNPKLEVLTPQNSQIIFIDHQPQMAFGVQSIDRQTLKNNVVALAKGAKVFKIPTTITTVETQGFSGYTYPELLDVFPDKPLLERTSMNSWDDKKVRDALRPTGATRWWFRACGPRCATTPSRCRQCSKAATRSTWSPTPPGARPRRRTTIRCSG